MDRSQQPVINKTVMLLCHNDIITEGLWFQSYLKVLPHYKDLAGGTTFDALMSKNVKGQCSYGHWKLIKKWNAELGLDIDLK